MIQYDKPHKPAGFEKITLSSTATTSGLTIPDDARYAKVKVLTQAIRYRDDGTEPTSIVGYSIAANGEFELISYEQLDAFKAAAQANGAVLEILYYKV